MKRSVIPLITTAVGMLLAFVLVASGATAAGEEQALPLLMMLFMSELGFIISLGGALYGIKLWQQSRVQRFLLLNAAAGIVLALGLLFLGITLWATANAA